MDGNIDSYTCDAFQTRAYEVIEGGAHYILIDLSHAQFISSAGFRSFNNMFNKLRSLYPDANLSDEEIKVGISNGTYKSPHLKLLNLPEGAMAAFQMAGFDLFLETYTDQKTAVASF